MRFNPSNERSNERFNDSHVIFRLYNPIHPAPCNNEPNATFARAAFAQPQSNCSPRDSNNVINVSKFRHARCVTIVADRVALFLYNYVYARVGRIARIALSSEEASASGRV